MLQSGGYANNPAYPPIHQAIREDSSTEDTGHLPQSGSHANNPAYPPIHQAVREDSSTQDTGHLTQSGVNANNPAYPPIHQAVREEQSFTEDTGHLPQSGANGNNPPYPPIHQAVQDGLIAKTAQQPEIDPGGSRANLSIHQAVNGTTTASINGQQPVSCPPEGNSLGAVGSNPPYLQIHQAVRTDSHALVSGTQWEQHNFGGGGSNPFYTTSFDETNSSAPSIGVSSQDPYKFLEDEEIQF